MNARVMALVDCNNFYVSCERVFNPKLVNRPVVVLSNNDGCAVARSNEAKSLGIKMGTPWFKLKELAHREGVAACSSNYALYADMSNRVMSILAHYSPRQEVYSIDECFLDLTGAPPADLQQRGREIRQRVGQWTGLPVCVGLAPTKTLAKLANHIAKRYPLFDGVCDLQAMLPAERDQWFSTLEVGEVWGVGRRLTPKLAEWGVHSVLDLMRADPARLRSRFSVMMEKTNRELNGEMCIELEAFSPPKQQIVSSRSFGIPVQDLQGLEEAVSLHAGRAAEKLRRQQSCASFVQVFIQTSPFHPRRPYYGNSFTLALPISTDDTMQISKIALSGLKPIYRAGYHYQKAGVMLSGIIPAAAVQPDLFAGRPDGRSKRVMKVLDGINRKLGRGTLHSARQGFTQPWHMKQEHKSPAYTTRWAELPEAVA